MSDHSSGIGRLLLAGLALAALALVGVGVLIGWGLT